MMTKSFTQLFEESLKKLEISLGSIVRGTVIDIKRDIVLVDAGLKSESNIPIEQFRNSQGKLEIQIGDQIDVVLDAMEDGFGETLLSREKAKRHEAWLMLEKSYQEDTIVIGKINNKVKGGFTVELHGIRAFLPGSLVDMRPIRDTLNLEGKEFEFKVIKLDKKRNNIVVSRRAVIESVNSAERHQLLENLQEGMNAKGIIKNLTDYGAFIDLGGIDGLLHITDMSWKRIKHPSEVVSIGDEITVKIIKFDKERTRVSLGLKQMSEDPWITILKRYPIGTYLNGRVTNLTDYGCFVEIENGIEGLVHISEMDWTNKNIHPSKVVNLNDFVKVVILDIDQDRRRISLGIKQCKVNPWQKFAESNAKGNRIVGKIKSITDFGIFIGLEGGIDGLIHFSDISWKTVDEDIIREYKKGDEITAIILQIDAERERISLGIKQLEEDPFNNFLLHKKKGSIVSGQVTSIDKKSLTLKLSDDIEGYLRISEVSHDHVKNILSTYNIGDTIEARLSSLDRKNRIINLTLCNKNESNGDICPAQQDEDHFSNVMAEAFRIATKD